MYSHENYRSWSSLHPDSEVPCAGHARSACNLLSAHVWNHGSVAAPPKSLGRLWPLASLPSNFFSWMFIGYVSILPVIMARFTWTTCLMFILVLFILISMTGGQHQSTPGTTWPVSEGLQVLVCLGEEFWHLVLDTSLSLRPMAVVVWSRDCCGSFVLDTLSTVTRFTQLTAPEQRNMGDLVSIWF